MAIGQSATSQERPKRMARTGRIDFTCRLGKKIIKQSNFIFCFFFFFEILCLFSSFYQPYLDFTHQPGLKIMQRGTYSYFMIVIKEYMFQFRNPEKCKNNPPRGDFFTSEKHSKTTQRNDHFK